MLNADFKDFVNMPDGMYIGEAAGAVPLHEAPLDGDICLAVGNEDHGCTAAVLAVADVITYIPQPGRVGSLNVAVAAAVAMAEARRRGWAPG